MKDSKLEQLTELTGYNYSIFGKTLDHVGRDEEHRELIKAGKDKITNFESEEECEKWIKEIETEVELGKQSIELTTQLYRDSIKNCVASTVLSIVAFFTLDLYFALLSLIPIAFFAIRIINFLEAFRMQSGFLQVGVWILRENVKKTYNPSSTIDFNAPVIEN